MGSGKMDETYNTLLRFARDGAHPLFRVERLILFIPFSHAFRIHLSKTKTLLPRASFSGFTTGRVI